MQIIKPKTYDIMDLNIKRFYEDIFKVFKRNISFGSSIDNKDQNIDGKMVEILDTGTANTEVAITHNLDRVPNFIDFKYKSIAGDVYDSGTQWTKTQIFVKFSIAHMKVRLFVH